VNKMEIELTPEVVYYIVRFHHHLMTDVEQRAQGHLVATLKATVGRSDAAAQEEARKSKGYSQRLSSDPEVLRLAREGYEAFSSANCQANHSGARRHVTSQSVSPLRRVGANPHRQAVPFLRMRLASAEIAGLDRLNQPKIELAEA
jgi:hypothetical protein